jgi:hypothetical protein
MKLSNFKDLSVLSNIDYPKFYVYK